MYVYYCSVLECVGYIPAIASINRQLAISAGKVNRKLDRLWPQPLNGLCQDMLSFPSSLMDIISLMIYYRRKMGQSKLRLVPYVDST